MKNLILLVFFCFLVGCSVNGGKTAGAYRGGSSIFKSGISLGF